MRGRPTRWVARTLATVSAYCVGSKPARRWTVAPMVIAGTRTPLSPAVWKRGSGHTVTDPCAPHFSPKTAPLPSPAMVTARWEVRTPLGREVVPEE